MSRGPIRDLRERHHLSQTRVCYRMCGSLMKPRLVTHIRRAINNALSPSSLNYGSDQTSGSIMSTNGLPHFAVGPIVKGFGRGSRELGIPTANFPPEVVQSLPEEITTGVYYGWASVGGGDVHKMVMSIGWNPFYQNTQKSMETHIIHEFPGDLYDLELRVVMLGFLRPEANFTTVDDLIAWIKGDIENAKKHLDEPDMAAYKHHRFFTEQNPQVSS